MRAPMENPTSMYRSIPISSRSAWASFVRASFSYAAELVGLVGEAVTAGVEGDDPVPLVEEPVENARAHPVDVDVADEAVEQHDRIAFALVVVEEGGPVEALEVRHAARR